MMKNKKERNKMKINVMSWNTNLFEYGNKLKNGKEKNIDASQFYEKINVIKGHLEKDNAIAILQEIPYKSNIDWKDHPLFTEFKKLFAGENGYEIIYIKSNENQIKMTVVLAKAKNNLIEQFEELGSNIYIPFKVKSQNLNILGVHAHHASELRKWLEENKQFIPDIIIGDFNAGNYKKDKNDDKISENRKDYLSLTEGYIDLVQGKETTKYHTQIDHILFRNQKEFYTRYNYRNCNVEDSICCSDHYPIYCTIESIEAE